MVQDSAGGLSRGARQDLAGIFRPHGLQELGGDLRMRRKKRGGELLVAAHGVGPVLSLTNASREKQAPGNETSPASVSRNTQPLSIWMMRPSVSPTRI